MTVPLDLTRYNSCFVMHNLCTKGIWIWHSWVKVNGQKDPLLDDPKKQTGSALRVTKLSVRILSLIWSSICPFQLNAPERLIFCVLMDMIIAQNITTLNWFEMISTTIRHFHPYFCDFSTLFTWEFHVRITSYDGHNRCKNWILCGQFTLSSQGNTNSMAIIFTPVVSLQ